MIRKILTIVVGLVLVFGSLIFCINYFLETSTTPLSPEGGVDYQKIANQPATTFNLQSKQGGQVTVLNFLNDFADSVERDEVTKTSNITISSTQYCEKYRTCTVQTNVQTYTIQFSSVDDLIYISLLSNPVKESRKQAEEALQTLLGLNADEMCDLRITVGVPMFINKDLTGRELGLSFCPDSVQL